LTLRIKSALRPTGWIATSSARINKVWTKLESKQKQEYTQKASL